MNRPIASLSNSAFAWHENEAYYAKALFFLFTFSEFQNKSLRVLQQYGLDFFTFSHKFSVNLVNRYNFHKSGKLCLQLTCFCWIFLTLLLLHACGIVMENMNMKSSKFTHFISFFYQTFPVLLAL